MPGLLIKILDESLYQVSIPYGVDDMIDRIKHIPGARYNDDIKDWTIPVESLDDFDWEFEGEIIYSGINREEALGLPPKKIPESYLKIKKRNVDNLKLPLRKFQEFGVNFLSKVVDEKGIALLGDLMG